MTDEKQKRKNSFTLAAIITVSFLPLVLAYTMFYTGIGVPENTVNNGVLFPVAVSTESALGEEKFSALNSEKKWRLILPIDDRCDEACQKNIYTTRQVHIRLGEKAIRVERVAINIGGGQAADYLTSIATEHPKLKVVDVERKKWNDWLVTTQVDMTALNEPYYLLLDQQGYAMMYYTNAQSGNQLIKDLKRALKHSTDYQ